MRLGVGLGGTGKITKQMLGGELVSQFVDLDGGVEVVVVVHDHRIGQILKHERFERLQPRSPSR